MAAKRRRKRKPVEDDLPNPGERQRCRLPDWWATTDPDDLKRAHDRAKQLIQGGYGAVDWIDWGKPL